MRAQQLRQRISIISLVLFGGLYLKCQFSTWFLSRGYFVLASENETDKKSTKGMNRTAFFNKRYLYNNCKPIYQISKNFRYLQSSKFRWISFLGGRWLELFARPLHSLQRLETSQHSPLLSIYWYTDQCEDIRLRHLSVRDTFRFDCQ